MIRKASIIRYRKLKSMTFDFTQYVNVLSGKNGTCKTSLLHIVSNSFQAVTRKCEWVNNPACLDVINRVNSALNPKIESLTKGDKLYNDPANGHKGTLLEIDYFGRESLSFRKHNSPKNNRYAVKPYYKRGTGDTLPHCPVVYLGLSRLFPFGEFQNDAAIESIKAVLPSEYQDEVAALYSSFTHILISSSTPQKMGDIKVRTDFSSDKEGIDSNTISAGEDNLHIMLTALVSLKYYFNSIRSANEVESILLIDELDATLHPSHQFKLMELFHKYAIENKIQVIFTTHSLSLVEFALKMKENVIYLIDNITAVYQMEFPDIYKIKMFLHNKTRDDIYIGKVIPVFTEDNEARVFLKILFDYYEANMSEFSEVRNFFHLVDANIGASNLVSIFSDRYLLKSTMMSICILDGDAHDKRNLTKHIIVLPGNKSPEKLIMDYSLYLLDNDDPFWIDEEVLNLNYGKMNFMANIKPDIDGIELKFQQMRNNMESTQGVTRELLKKVFIKHQRFFEFLFKHWANNTEHEGHVDKFCKDLFIMFRKVSEFHGINPNMWITNT